MPDLRDEVARNAARDSFAQARVIVCAGQSEIERDAMRLGHDRGPDVVRRVRYHADIDGDSVPIKVSSSASAAHIMSVTTLAMKGESLPITDWIGAPALRADGEEARPPPGPLLRPLLFCAAEAFIDPSQHYTR